MNINYSHALKILVSEVIFNSRSLDKAIESLFKNTPGIRPGDKENLYHLFMFVIRYWITIHEIYKNIFSSRNIDFHEILHIQQILENHIYGKFICTGKYEKKVIDIYSNISGKRAMRESIPDWLDNLCYKELGDEWDVLASALNQAPSKVIRVNNLKTNRAELLAVLKNAGRKVSPLDDYPDAIVLEKHFDIFNSEEFQSGMFEIQDAGSQKIAPLLDIKPGMRVIDACAGNGGKTLHIADLLKNKGKVIALDVAPHKLETLKKRMNRASAFNIETRLIDSSKVLKRLNNSADRLLLDVPCSGTGVLKRNPDIKYHLTEEKLKAIHQTQTEILDRYSGMLKNNGIMVYATCSILPSENQQPVKSFLERKQGEFELLEEKTLSPFEGFDGFYMAKILRCS